MHIAAFAEDLQGRPTGLPDDEASSFVKVARAIQSRDPSQADEVMRGQRAAAREHASLAEDAIRNASGLGRIDDAFLLADAYYFGRGFIIPDSPSKGSGFSPEQRQPRLLFEPVTKPMRADPRFERLVVGLGLDRYWRASGKPPDYRRTRV